MNATYTFDVFATLDGYGSYGPGGDWGGGVLATAPARSHPFYERLAPQPTGRQPEPLT